MASARVRVRDFRRGNLGFSPQRENSSQIGGVGDWCDDKVIQIRSIYEQQLL
jgi:hypothetical protein